MSQVSSEFRRILTDGLETLASKISVLNDISKDAWRELSGIEEQSKAMISTIDEIANAKVTQLSYCETPPILNFDFCTQK